MTDIRYRRKTEGVSAILLPFHTNGTPDYDGFLTHIDRTYTAGLTPAINMDTGYANLLTREQRLQILDLMPALPTDANLSLALLSRASLVIFFRSTPAKQMLSNSAAAHQ